ncbi:MAG TPA: BON domain-containing protein [Myxococcaceae bacterium]|jgi:hypothetical protein
MADRRYEDELRRDRGGRRDPETERRIDRLADRYRGSDERGYGGGERLGREWERGDPRDIERFGQDPRVRSFDEQRFDRGGRDERDSRGVRPARGERRVRDSGRDRDVRRYADVDRDRRGDSPSGAFHDRESHPRDHSRLAGLHDMGDSSELRERYREHVRQRDYQPRYGHGPGVENMEAPRTGYSTATTRGDDHELGHGGMLGAGNYRRGAPMPTGRGPKGYQRSDDRIREDICDGLMMSWMNAENVDIQVRNGEVTLTGTVKSRDEKRAIEALAESVLGVKDLINTLRVERRDQPRAEPQEQRAQSAEQTSAPGDTSLHS